MNKFLITTSLAVIFAALHIQAQPADFSKKPDALPASTMAFPKYSETTLSNGIKLYVIEDHEQPIVNFRMTLWGGDYSDDLKSGLASLTTDMLTKGAGKRSANQIADALDGVGASLSASSGGDRFSVSGDALKKHLPILMEIFADVVMRPAFPQEEFDKLVAQNLASVKSQRGNAGQLAAAMARKVTYGMHHPYGRKATEESLNSITLDDVKKVHASFFIPNNVTMAVTGNISADEAKKMLEKAFATWKKGVLPTMNIPPVKPEPIAIYFVHRPSSVQSSVHTSSLAMPNNDPQYEALQLCSNVMGNSFGGRLNKTLRETYSYTYSPYAYLTNAPLANRFSCAADVRNAVTDSTIIVIRRELAKIAGEPIPNEELNDMKRYVVGNYLLNFESSETVANIILNAVNSGKPISWVKEYPTRYMAINSQQVLDVAAKYVKPEQTSVVVVGNPDVIPALKKLGTVYEFDLDLKPVKAAEKTSMNIGELLSKHIEALGGKEKIGAVKTMTYKGKASIEMGANQMTGTVIRKNKEGGKATFTLDLGMMKQQVWISGQKVWASMMGQPAKELTGEEAEDYMDEAYIFPSAHLTDNPHIKQMNLLGLKDGMYILETVYDSGIKKHLYFDAGTFLLTKEDAPRKTPRGEVITTQKYSNYKEVSGVMLPGIIESELGGPVLKAEVGYEINKPIEDKEFTP
ncbi:hypothetical protein MASR2M18_03080 [Ignavibacteria bacterium]|nr:insulinase family protein [Bacteroidota bacterium]MCZ2132825.1 insulinase family protein [Bacteroidota bacterium]